MKGKVVTRHIPELPNAYCLYGPFYGHYRVGCGALKSYKFASKKRVCFLDRSNKYTSSSLNSQNHMSRFASFISEDLDLLLPLSIM